MTCRLWVNKLILHRGREWGAVKSWFTDLIGSEIEAVRSHRTTLCSLVCAQITSDWARTSSSLYFPLFRAFLMPSSVFTGSVKSLSKLYAYSAGLCAISLIILTLIDSNGCSTLQSETEHRKCRSRGNEMIIVYKPASNSEELGCVGTLIFVDDSKGSQYICVCVQMFTVLQVSGLHYDWLQRESHQKP